MMKKLTAILLVFVFAFQANAQKITTEEVIDMLMHVDAIVQYKTFRKDLEKSVKELTANERLINKPEQYNKLRAAYMSTKKEYDGFLVLIKSDLSDLHTIKQMTKKPQKYALKYMLTFENAMEHYEDTFVPVYNEISNSRAIPVVYVKLAIEAFEIIVGYIQKRREDKMESYNFVLAKVNELFFDKLKLKDWDDLVSYKPVKEKQNDADDIAGNAEKQNTSTDAKTQPKKEKRDEYSNDDNETYVPYPTATDMIGRIEFVYVSQRNPIQTERMIFSKKAKNRDLIVGELIEKTEYSGDYFLSKDAYPEKTAFQIKVTNSAFLYVFAFNSNNKCYNIYPFSDEWVKAYNMDRDLSVGELPGKDDFTNETVIPSKNAKTGNDNYIIISGKAEKEQLCIILSKSELDIQDVYNKIDNMQGNIFERINAVFSENIISADSAGLDIDEGMISFNAVDSKKTVLPLIFYIKRK